MIDDLYAPRRPYYTLVPSITTVVVSTTAAAAAAKFGPIAGGTTWPTSCTIIYNIKITSYATCAFTRSNFVSQAAPLIRCDLRQIIIFYVRFIRAVSCRVGRKFTALL